MAKAHWPEGQLASEVHAAPALEPPTQTWPPFPLHVPPPGQLAFEVQAKPLLVPPEHVPLQEPLGQSAFVVQARPALGPPRHTAGVVLWSRRKSVFRLDAPPLQSMMPWPSVPTDTQAKPMPPTNTELNDAVAAGTVTGATPLGSGAPMSSWKLPEVRLTVIGAVAFCTTTLLPDASTKLCRPMGTPGVCVGVMVGVSVGEAVRVGVPVFVGVLVFVGVAVMVGVPVGVRVSVGV